MPGLAGNLFGLPLPVPDWSKPIILALVLISLALAIRAWLSARRARRLERERASLTADLELMQSALVPAIPARLGTLGVSVAYRPAEGPAAGGDFYDAFPLPGGRAAIIVGDVSGHGRTALARAAHMHYTLRAYVETGLDPRSALKLAGRVLEPEGDELFATVVIAVYDAGSATLTYASAGHPAPIFLGPAAREPLSGSASPAIGWGASTGRRQSTVPFPQGARACLFSDGLIEARCDGELLGRERLADYLEQAGSEPAAELLARVAGRADSIRDDMAACVISATAGMPRSEHRFEELEVDSAQLELGQANSFLAACGVETAQVARVLAEARRISADQGSAVVVVELTGESATARAAAPTAISLGATEAAPSHPAGRHGPRGRGLVSDARM